MASIIDNVGRRVVAPDDARRVATVGAVPQLNTYLFTLGLGDAIVNGLSAAGSSRFKYQEVFAPTLAGRPDLSAADGVDVDLLKKLEPDLALVKIESMADLVERETGVPTLVLPPRSPDGIKNGVRALGEIFDRKARAERYIRYVDDAEERVLAVTATVPRLDRPSVLYLHHDPLARRGFTMEWTIPKAGGRSILEGSTTSSHRFTVADLMTWDPDVLVCTEADGRTRLMNDPSFSSLRAVRSGRVHVAPTGGHGWGNGCTEQPLALIWLAKILHPEAFGYCDMVEETAYFYREFYDTELTAGQIDEILHSRY